MYRVTPAYPSRPSRTRSTHIRAAADVEKQAKLNGYMAPTKSEATGKDGASLIPDEWWRRMQDAAKKEEKE